MADCKRCLLLESGREDIYESISQHIKKIKPAEKCSGSEYEKRLGICKSCDFLSGGTCLKCGCYPEFRAAFSNQSCPYKKW